MSVDRRSGNSYLFAVGWNHFAETHDWTGPSLAPIDATMILTPIDVDQLESCVADLDGGVGDEWTRAILRRITRPEHGERARGSAAAHHHRAACGVLRSLGMRLREGSPHLDFSWDGRSARIETEAYVLLHEAAHFQLAAPHRRSVIDFGLGPGPETGDHAGALRAQCLDGIAREREEAMASLLGILWEMALGQPALASFLDQNWLEGASRPGTAAHFAAILGALRRGGFIDAAGRPLRYLRDSAQESALRGPAK